MLFLEFYGERFRDREAERDLFRKGGWRSRRAAVPAIHCHCRLLRSGFCSFHGTLSISLSIGRCQDVKTTNIKEIFCASTTARVSKMLLSLVQRC